MGDKMRDKTNEPVKELKGLTEQEVELRVEQGLDNRADTTTDKSIKEIIFSNAFTYFNLIFLIISILLLCVKSYRNLTFLPIVIGNTLIGIVQELRAKKILDKMNLLNAPHATVLREGMQKQILSEELVKDDIVVLRGYSCAAEPPVQYRLSHLSRRSEPLIKHTICMMRVYSRNALSNPYTSRMEISCSASMLVMLMR